MPQQSQKWLREVVVESGEVEVNPAHFEFGARVIIVKLGLVEGD